MSHPAKRPNLFIVGAPKCGTTSLAAWLSEHSQVFMSSPKEPNHFNTDLINTSATFRYFEDRRDYETLFMAAKSEHRIIGEASARYLCSSRAITNILAYDTAARFIAIIRNPLEMVISLHGHHVRDGTDDNEDLETAWRLQSERANGHFIPPRCYTPQFLQYGKVCSIGKQLKRMYESVSPEQRHVVVLDDLKRNPLKEWKAICKFLGIGDDGRTQFSVHNPAHRMRSTRVRAATRIVGQVKESLGLPKFRFGILRRVDSLNRRKRPNDPISPNLEAELREYFRDDVALLGELLKRDFSGWLTSNARF